MDHRQPEELIFTMVREADWREAQRLGAYHGSADDRADGFLHFSSAGQLCESARRHRAGEADLVLVAVEAARLGPALRWEYAASRGEAFPHLYGPLAVSDVLWVSPLPLGAGGEHVFPDSIPSGGG